MAVKINKKSGVKHKKMPSGKGHSSIVKDDDGVPLADPPRYKSTLGSLPPPDTEGKTYLEKEKVIGQVEILMLKGVITPNHVANTLGIAFVTAKRYMEQVHYRWAILGGAPRMRQLKGEAKARLELITNELWVMYSNTTDERVKGACLSQLLGVHDRRLVIDGLTPKTLPLIAETELEGDDGPSVIEKIQDHAEMVRLSKALIAYTGKKPEPVDAEFTEIKD